MAGGAGRSHQRKGKTELPCRADQKPTSEAWLGTDSLRSVKPQAPPKHTTSEHAFEQDALVISCTFMLERHWIGTHLPLPSLTMVLCLKALTTLQNLVDISPSLTSSRQWSTIYNWKTQWLFKWSSVILEVKEESIWSKEP